MIRNPFWLLIVALAPVAAAAEGHAVAARAGLLGLGVEYTYSMTDRVSFRFGINGGSLGFDAEESGIDYAFDFSWDSLSAAVDFHPRRTALRLSIGVLGNDNSMTAVSRPNGSVEVGGVTYTAEQVGTLRGVITFDDTAPFAGIGWDWSRGRRPFGLSLDLGVVAQGAPVVRLSADGELAAEPLFADSVAREQRELQASLDDLDVVPYASLGFVFRF